jgi:predicted Zn-dependent protease
MMMMKLNRHWLWLMATAAALALSGCATESTTQGGAVGANRKQMMLVSAQEMNQASLQFYQEEMGKAKTAGKLNGNATQTQRVRAIAQRLIPNVAVFRPDAVNWAWEVNVLDDPQVNAYCAPGGKIAVYTGLITKINATDDELAAVMGHEIAHALREHSRERASKEMVTGLGAAVLGAATGVDGQLTGMMGNLMFTLPNSRDNESEADRIGLELAARAGYNPQGAVTLWQKMNAQGGGSPPQWLSTHPSGDSRIADLQKTMPAVMPLYTASRKK